MPETLRIGLDIGSTTIKCVVLNEADKIIYSCYERHLSLIAQKTRELLTRLNNEVVHGAPVRLSISGSAGMGLALGSHISFVQEVYATKVAADMLMPGTDVIIERRIRQDGRAAPAQSGRGARGCGALYLHGRGQPDHRGAGAGSSD